MTHWGEEAAGQADPLPHPTPCLGTFLDSQNLQPCGVFHCTYPCFRRSLSFKTLSWCLMSQWLFYKWNFRQNWPTTSPHKWVSPHGCSAKILQSGPTVLQSLLNWWDLVYQPPFLHFLPSLFCTVWPCCTAIALFSLQSKAPPIHCCVKKTLAKGCDYYRTDLNKSAFNSQCFFHNSHIEKYATRTETRKATALYLCSD